MTRLLVDTGPLVALLSKGDRHHDWVTRAWRVRAELVTCEAVIAEAAFLLSRRAGAVDLLFAFLEDGAVRVKPMGPELTSVRALMRRYASVPMSFADGCLVRLSELDPRSVVATCDTDFQVYRRLGRSVIPLLAPFSSKTVVSPRQSPP